MTDIIIENSELKIDDSNTIHLNCNLIIGANGILEILNSDYIKFGANTNKIILKTTSSKILFIGGTSANNSLFIANNIVVDTTTGANSTQITTDSLPYILSTTKVKTIRGYIMAKDLTHTDVLITQNDRHVNIKNIYASDIKTTINNSPYIIPAHYFSRNYPKKQFMISPLHAIATNKKALEWFIPKIHGKELKRMQVGENIKYYHIELPNWLTDHLIIENETIVESYAKNFHVNTDCVYYIKSAKTGYYKRDEIQYKHLIKKQKKCFIRENKIIFE